MSYLRYFTAKVTEVAIQGNCRPLGTTGHNALQGLRAGEATYAARTRCQRNTSWKPGEQHMEPGSRTLPPAIHHQQPLLNKLWYQLTKEKCIKGPDIFSHSSQKGSTYADRELMNHWHRYILT